MWHPSKRKRCSNFQLTHKTLCLRKLLILFKPFKLLQHPRRKIRFNMFVIIFVLLQLYLFFINFDRPINNRNMVLVFSLSDDAQHYKCED